MSRQELVEAGLHQVQKTWSPYSRAPASLRSKLRSIWRVTGFDAGLASALRYELDMSLLRLRCSLGRSYKRQVAKLASRRDLYVHLGCGNALFSGWVNVDCYPPPVVAGAEILTLDMRKGLPFASGSVSAVFSEHFLEHLSVDVVRHGILPEIRRILAPGGVVRIGVPNGEYFIEQYLSASRKQPCDDVYSHHRGERTPMTMLNEIAHGYGHRFLYDFETLACFLRDVGLCDVQRLPPGRTQTAIFEGRDRHDEWRMAMSLYVEARAPM